MRERRKKAVIAGPGEPGSREQTHPKRRLRRLTLDPFSYHPTFHMILRLLGLEVTQLNDLARAYGKFDFKRGWFDLVIETDAKEGQLTGYVKPLFRSLKVFSLAEDLKEDTVLQFFWQALLGATTSVFRNFPRDQVGTLIPFHGDLSGATTVDLLATVGNLLRNAFVRACLPRLEKAWFKRATKLVAVEKAATLL